SAPLPARRCAAPTAPPHRSQPDGRDAHRRKSRSPDATGAAATPPTRAHRTARFRSQRDTGRSLVNRNQPLFNFVDAQRLDLVERERLRDVELVRRRATKRREVCATTELLAEIMCDCPHIRAFRATQT